MDAKVWIDPDQVGVKRGVVDLRQRQTVWDDRLAEVLVGVRDDVCCVEQARLRQTGDGAAAIVGGEHRLPKGGLMQALERVVLNQIQDSPTV